MTSLQLLTPLTAIVMRANVNWIKGEATPDVVEKKNSSWRGMKEGRETAFADEAHTRFRRHLGV
jgi:hypothetical protein